MEKKLFRKKIMVVDDNKDFLREFQETLTSNCFNVIPVSNSSSVPYLVQELKPDLIFLDLKMEGMDGYQVAEVLKRLPATANIPIIAMTGFVTEEDHASLMRLCGIKTCLRKPLKTEYVICLIKLLL